MNENTIIIFPVKNPILYEIADDPREYLCKNCYIFGRMDNGDAPIQITRLERQAYWQQLQTNRTFVPIRLTVEVFEELIREGQELREAWEKATRGTRYVRL